MSDDTLHAAVDFLYIYPIKSCAGLRVPHLQFTDDGLIEGDRVWVIVNNASEVVWQGSHPRLALVHPHVAPGLLRLSSSTGLVLALPDPPTGAACLVHIWNNSLQRNEAFEGIDAGDAACAWLQQATGYALRLVRLSATAWATATAKHCHIASVSSLAELHAALVQQGLPTAEMERFRPNIVITNGASVLDPFVEEYCAEIRWHDAGRGAHMAVRENCIRCVVPNVDPHDASVTHQTLETVTRLSAERHPGKPVYFGIYAQSQQTATLRAGEPIELVLRF